MSAPRAIRWNGVTVDATPATSRGLHYGDGVFRTMLQIAGTIVDVDAQIAKLRHDATALGLVPPALDALRSELASVADFGDATVKLLLIRAGSGRGYRPETDEADRLLLVYEPPRAATTTPFDGLRVIRSPVTMAAQPRLAGIKHLNRLEQVLASRDWPDGTDDAILGDDRGAPVCATRGNLFWVQDGRLNTPAIDRCGVAGVMRDKVLAAAEALDLPCRIAAQPWPLLMAADEAFLCNSLRGIQPIQRLDDRLFGAPGPVTRRLIRHLAHPTLPSR